METDNVVARLIDELNRKAEEIREIVSTLQTLQKYGAQVELPQWATLLDTKEQSASPGIVKIRPDEFYSLSNTDAAERYLRKIGHAAPLSDIYDALIEGGLKFSGDGKKNLNIQLTRATKKFAKIGSGHGVSFGMLEWYPRRKKLTVRQEDKELESTEQESKPEDNHEEGIKDSE